MQRTRDDFNETRLPQIKEEAWDHFKYFPSGTMTQEQIRTEYRSSLLDKQEGKCAICGNHMVTPCLDHNHDNDLHRGLLCNLCNTGLGMFRDSKRRLIRAARYLKMWEVRHRGCTGE